MRVIINRPILSGRVRSPARKLFITWTIGAVRGFNGLPDSSRRNEKLVEIVVSLENFLLVFAFL